jgi:hypothetical protein
MAAVTLTNLYLFYKIYDKYLDQTFEIWSIIRLNYTSGFIMISKEHLTARYESI